MNEPVAEAPTNPEIILAPPEGTSQTVPKVIVLPETQLQASTPVAPSGNSAKPETATRLPVNSPVHPSSSFVSPYSRH